MNKNKYKKRRNRVMKANNLNKIRKNKLPFSVSLEINNICNAKCTFCAYGKEKPKLGGIELLNNPILDKRPKQHLSKEVFRHVLSLCEPSGSGINKKMSITPTLGEATVSKDWLDLVRLAKKSKGVRILSTYTNAINLHRFGVRNILESGIDVLAISSSLVDRKSYKRIYGRDRYDQVLKNIIEILKENKKKGFPVDIYLNLRIDLPSEDFIKSNNYKILSQYIEDRKITFLKKYDNYGGTVKLDDLPYGTSFVNIENNSNKPPCYQLFRQLMVNVDGTIQACTCRVDESLFTRNILDFNSLEDAWKNDKLEKIRDNWEKSGVLPKACVSCTHYGSYENLVKYSKIYPKIKSHIHSFLKGGLIHSRYKKVFSNVGSIQGSTVNEKK